MKYTSQRDFQDASSTARGPPDQAIGSEKGLAAAPAVLGPDDDLLKAAEGLLGIHLTA